MKGEKKIIWKTYFPKGKLRSNLKFPNSGTPKGAANNISDSPSCSEITLQFVSALDHSLICVTTAEGQGSTEADDIRIAINRALEALFKE